MERQDIPTSTMTGWKICAMGAFKNMIYMIYKTWIKNLIEFDFFWLITQPYLVVASPRLQHLGGWLARPSPLPHLPQPEVASSPFSPPKMEGFPVDLFGFNWMILDDFGIKYLLGRHKPNKKKIVRSATQIASSFVKRTRCSVSNQAIPSKIPEGYEEQTQWDRARF